MSGMHGSLQSFGDSVCTLDLPQTHLQQCRLRRRCLKIRLNPLHLAWGRCATNWQPACLPA